MVGAAKGQSRLSLKRNDLPSMIANSKRNLLKAATTFPIRRDRLFEDRNNGEQVQ